MEVSSARHHLRRLGGGEFGSTPFAMILIVWIVCWSGAVWWRCDAVGIKRRLAEAEEQDEAPSEAAASSTDTRPKGGIKRRLEAAETQGSSSSTKKVPFTERVIQKWASGKMSASEVQAAAMDAMAQGARDLDKLSSMGSAGDHPQNCLRALKNLLGLPKGAPDVTWVEIPTSRGAKTLHPFLMPHDFFASYFQGQQAKWASALAGPQDAAKEFWKSMRDTDFVQRHPFLPEGLWEQTIPLGMHGDGASFSKQDSSYVFSWNSLIGAGQTMQKRFVATVIRKTDMVDGTIDRISKVLSWSFNAILSGKFPRESWDGKALPGGDGLLAKGWRGALCQVRGDWAFYCEIFRFPQWNAAERMCWLCKASSTDPSLAWVKYGPDAKWRETRWSHESYMRFLRGAGIAIPALLAFAIGFRLECIMIDVLHTVDQGVASHIVGNVLWYFAVVRKMWGGTTQQQQIEHMFKHMQKWYKGSQADSKVKGKVTVERVRTKGNWPKLKAKAAATRQLAAYVLLLAQTFGDGSRKEMQILGLCQLLVDFYRILESSSQFLSAEARDQLPKIGRRLVGIYTALATSAKEAGVKMWKLNPKLHLFLHLCEWQAVSHGNPRYYWTYADEDLAGKMAEVAASCHPKTMALNALFKWLHIAFDRD